ncbi:MAG: hypothetical protein QNJ34_17810 [Xenococcaceae cyanobacterium MO_188.B29]|nr:hypothetical protein [Xenococcaceae cyanobacterium MO_188.B29]
MDFYGETGSIMAIGFAGSECDRDIIEGKTTIEYALCPRTYLALISD